MFAQPRTTPAESNIFQDRVDISSLSPGSTVQFVTASGKTYWVVTVIGAMTTANNTVRGVSISTNSKNFGQIVESPMETEVSRVIRVGDTVRINDGRTSKVRQVEVIRLWR